MAKADASQVSSDVRAPTRAERVALGIKSIPPRQSLSVACGHCGAATDPLRACRVRVNESQFHYFCSDPCCEQYVPGLSPTAKVSVETDDDFLGARTTNSPPPTAPIDARSELERLHPPRPTLPWQRQAFLFSASGLAAAACLATTISAPPPSLIAMGSLACGSALLLASGIGNPPARRERNGFGVAMLDPRAGPLLAAAATVYSLIAGSVDLAVISTGTSLLCLLSSLCHFAEFLEAQRIIGQCLASEALGPSERTHGFTPGELVALQAPFQLSEDATILSGKARVRTWPGASEPAERSSGDTLYSGATIEQGSVQVVVRWTKNDRSHLRLLCTDSHQAKPQTRLLRTTLKLSRHGALGSGLLCALSSSFASHTPERILFSFAVGFSVLASCELSGWLQLLLTRQVHRFVTAGVFFRNTQGLDRIGEAPSAVLCALTSLLHNKPQVGNIEPLSPSLSKDDLLRLATAGYANVQTAIGRALEHACAAVGSHWPPARSPQHRPGLGTIAVTSEGKTVVVGTRALLLAQRISIASAEPRILHYEKLGRSVLLIALDGRLVGLLALQDRLQRGARGAIQNLLRINIEPVLISEESRETCQALASTLGISYFRPEVLPDTRDEIIRTLGASRSPLVVVGRASIDGSALEAADFSINLEGRGAPLELCDVEIASRAVQDATYAIAACKQLRQVGQKLLLRQLLPTSVALIAIALGGPLWLAAVGTTMGTVLAWTTMRQALVNQ